MLLGVEGLRAQNDFIRTVPYTLTMLDLDHPIIATGVLTRDSPPGSAQTNFYQVLDN